MEAGNTFIVENVKYPKVNTTSVVAYCQSDGLVCNGIKLSPSEAIEFAKWILKQYDRDAGREAVRRYYENHDEEE